MWKITKWILWACKAGMMVAVPAMTLLVFVNVILRYGFQNSLSWVDELARYLLVWSTSLGSVYASDQGMHISLDFLRERLHGRAKTAAAIFIHLAAMAFFLAGAWYGGVYSVSGWIQSSASLGLNMTYIYASIPVAFALMLLIEINHFWIDIKNMGASRESAETEKIKDKAR